MKPGVGKFLGTVSLRLCGAQEEGTGIGKKKSEKERKKGDREEVEMGNQETEKTDK